MQDRVPLYPGRVKLNPVSGQENTYDMVRADEPTQEGDPLSKATFLKDNTAASFGLGSDAVPDDALALLSRFQSSMCNEYVWSRHEFNVELGDVAGTQLVFGATSKTSTISYSEEIDNDGNLINPQTVTISYNTYTNAAVLVGKYFTADALYYSKEGSVYSQVHPTSSFYGVYIDAQKVTISKPIVGYVNSNDINAYPPEIDDGYLYTALGRIGDILGGQTT